VSALQRLDRRRCLEELIPKIRCQPHAPERRVGLPRPRAPAGLVPLLESSLDLRVGVALPDLPEADEDFSVFVHDVDRAGQQLVKLAEHLVAKVCAVMRKDGVWAADRGG